MSAASASFWRICAATVAIAHRLARLTLQTVGLAVDLLQHVFEARQIFRRRR